ncbi:hypothetical protein [Streptomyces pseudovenezuelae]|uniref:Histidine kinase n=1 Tax=Streptomyces pseudovenezuelae TaxID=67350 RepID=A0ABT6LIR9_9ACTN|nr:hypothetical protein [Streptomyces pseudovenezuelae]MDH6215531.1 hypothetical protein [Streptomyces pseudovenezuelae]
MDTTRDIPAHTTADRALTHARRIAREPFTAGTWRRFAYGAVALPVGLASIPLALVGAPTGRWQRGVMRRVLGPEAGREAGGAGGGTGGGARSGLVHAVAALPLNLFTLFVTVYGWLIVPMNLGWPLRAGDDYSGAWGGPTFAGAWAFHALLGGVGFLLLMPWIGRGLTALQLRLAHRFLA